MKKIISLCISLVLLAGLCIPMTVSASTYAPTVFLNEDFEDASGVAAVTYLKGSNNAGSNGWSYHYFNHTPTDSQRAQISLPTESGNTVLKSRTYVITLDALMT